MPLSTLSWKHWFALPGWLERALALGVSVWIVPLSLGCPSHQTVEHKCELWAAVAGEVLVPGQMVAAGKSLELFLLTLSVAVLSCSPRSPWESESKGSWVQTPLGRTQHQRCFPRVIPPRNQGNFMSLSSPQCCNAVFMTHQFFFLFCHCFPSGWPSSFPAPLNASCSAGPFQRLMVLLTSTAGMLSVSDDPVPSLPHTPSPCLPLW